MTTTWICRLRFHRHCPVEQIGRSRRHGCLIRGPSSSYSVLGPVLSLRTRIRRQGLHCLMVDFAAFSRHFSHSSDWFWSQPHATPSNQKDKPITPAADAKSADGLRKCSSINVQAQTDPCVSVSTCKTCLSHLISPNPNIGDSESASHRVTGSHPASQSSHCAGEEGEKLSQCWWPGQHLHVEAHVICERRSLKIQCDSPMDVFIDQKRCFFSEFLG